MKVFISQAMNGLTDEEILKVRYEAKTALKSKLGDIEIIDSFIHENVPEGAGRLWYLGASIQLMQDANLVYFCPGWEKACGCQIEHAVCLNYDIPILYA